MEKIGCKRINGELSSEAYSLERSELDESYLPLRLDIDELPKFLVVYLYGAYDNKVLGYVLTNDELSVMYAAGVVVNGRLSWSELGGEVE